MSTRFNGIRHIIIVTALGFGFSAFSARDSDIEITRKLRQEIQRDVNLSKIGDRIQIVTLGDTITLKGKVTSPEEKKRLHDIAIRVARDHDIKDEIQVRAE